MNLFVVKWIKDYPTNFQIQSKSNQFYIWFILWSFHLVPYQAIMCFCFYTFIHKQVHPILAKLFFEYQIHVNLWKTDFFLLAITIWILQALQIYPRFVQDLRILADYIWKPRNFKFNRQIFDNHHFCHPLKSHHFNLRLMHLREGHLLITVLYFVSCEIDWLYLFFFFICFYLQIISNFINFHFNFHYFKTHFTADT